MSLGDVYVELGRDEIKILRIIERFQERFLFVPAELVERRARLPPSRLSQSYRRLTKLKLVKRSMVPEVGYSLTYRGLDIVALDDLVRKGVVDSLAGKLGVGKEAEVYLGFTRGGEKVVVKFHRAGSASFKKVKRRRLYVARATMASWLSYSKLVAEREFKVMDSLHSMGARVPKPIAWSKNAIAQAYVEGRELYKVDYMPEEKALNVLKTVLDTIRLAYRGLGVVHGDLSEYNILVTMEGEAYIIDWPQYVYKEDPEADRLLRRDLEYVVRFFRKRFGAGLDFEEAVKLVVGEGERA